MSDTEVTSHALTSIEQTSGLSVEKFHPAFDHLAYQSVWDEIKQGVRQTAGGDDNMNRDHSNSDLRNDFRDLRKEMVNRDAQLQADMREREQRYREDSKEREERFQNLVREIRQEAKEREERTSQEAKEREERARQEAKEREERTLQAIEKGENRAVKAVEDLRSELQSGLQDVKESVARSETRIDDTAKHVQSMVTTNFWNGVILIASVVGLAITIWVTLWM